MVISNCRKRDSCLRAVLLLDYKCLLSQVSTSSSKLVDFWLFLMFGRALSSAGLERPVHIGKVTGSSPVEPTGLMR